MAPAYIGINNIPKKLSNIYIGVNNIPKKVIKGYVGVNGVPKLFWDSSHKSSNSWDYWTSVSSFKYFFNRVTKVNNKIAYYATIKVKNTFNNTRWYYPLMISTDADAVTSSYGGSTQRYFKQITDSEGLTWYVLGCWISGFVVDTMPVPEDLLNDEFYEYNSREESIYDTVLIQAAQDLLDRIYSVPFHEDYQVGQMYNVSTIFHGDVLKTLRKTIGIALFLNVSRYGVSTSYTAFSDNIDSIISTLMSLIGTDTFVGISLSGTASSNDIELRVGHPYNYSTNFSIREKSSRNSFEYYVGLQNFAATVDDVVTVSSSGVIQYTRPTPPGYYPTIIGFNVYSNVINSTNMGIDL